MGNENKHKEATAFYCTNEDRNMFLGFVTSINTYQRISTKDYKSVTLASEF